MSYVAFIGFAMMILITVLLLKKKVSTLFSFSIIPVVGAILVGAGPTQIGKYIVSGVAKTSDITLLMLFSLPYFTLMSDAGLFDNIVKKILKRTKLSAPLLCVLTVIIAMIAELDGSVTSVFLITIPLMLPLYKKYHMDARILVFLTAISILIMCNTPWNPRVLRSASLMSGTPNAGGYIFTHIFPLQVVAVVILLAAAVTFGIKQKKNSNGDEEVSSESVINMMEETELSRPKLFYADLLLTVSVIAALCIFPNIPSYFVFAVGLTLALVINYPDLGLQNKLLKKYASSLFPVAPAILLSGVVVGVLQSSGMLDEMVKVLVKIIPSALGSWIYIILALLSTPLMLIFTNDTWYYALIPIVVALESKYGVPANVVILTMFMNFGAMISPVAQPQIYIATELADGMELSDYVKFTVWKLWGLNVIWVAAGCLLGIFI